MSNFLGPPPLCGARTRAIVIVSRAEAIARDRDSVPATPYLPPLTFARALEHAGDALLLQFLAHHPGNVPVVGLEPAAHHAATFGRRGRARDRDRRSRAPCATP